MHVCMSLIPCFKGQAQGIPVFRLKTRSFPARNKKIPLRMWPTNNAFVVEGRI